MKNNPKRLKIKMYSFLKFFLVLMKLLSLSQFYAPKYSLFSFDARKGFESVRSKIRKLFYYPLFRVFINQGSSVY